MLAFDLLFLKIPPGEALSPRAHLGEAAMGVRREFGVHARLGFLYPFLVYALGSPLSWPRCSSPCRCTLCHSPPCRAVLIADLQPWARPAARSCCPSIEAESPNPNHLAAPPCFDSLKVKGYMCGFWTSRDKLQPTSTGMVSIVDKKILDEIFQPFYRIRTDGERIYGACNYVLAPFC